MKNQFVRGDDEKDTIRMKADRERDSLALKNNSLVKIINESKARKHSGDILEIRLTLKKAGLLHEFQEYMKDEQDRYENLINLKDKFIDQFMTEVGNETQHNLTERGTVHRNISLKTSFAQISDSEMVSFFWKSKFGDSEHLKKSTIATNKITNKAYTDSMRVIRLPEVGSDKLRIIKDDKLLEIPSPVQQRPKPKSAEIFKITTGRETKENFFNSKDFEPSNDRLKKYIFCQVYRNEREFLDQ